MGQRRRLGVLGGTALVLAGCTLLAALMRPHFDSAGLTMVYLLGVVVVAVAFGRGPATVAAVLSVALFDFLFVPPPFTFGVDDAQYLVVFAVMLAVALTIGTLTARLREQREEARARERRAAALYRLSHDLAVRSTIPEVLEAAVTRIEELVGARAAASMFDGRSLSRVAGDASSMADGPERAAAEWAFANGQMAGAPTGIPPGAGGVHLPLTAGTRTLGVLSIHTSESRDLATLDLLRALSSQTALATERCRLAEDAQRAKAEMEAERARNALLSSVSHDLRTPLAAIAGAASSLATDASLSVSVRGELAGTIAEETERLDRLIGNLLDMTRVDSGTLRVRKEWHSIEEVIGAALTRLEGTLGGRPVHVALSNDLPLVPMDAVLFETVLRNLIENAHKYSDGAIEVSARTEDGFLSVEVADRGPGLPQGDERRIFEKFYRGMTARATAGVGLGLSICSGVVQAHGGTVGARNRAGGGALFTVRLPLEGAPPSVEIEREVIARA